MSKKNDNFALKNPMVVSYVETRDPKTPKTSKTWFATSTLMRVSVHLLYIINKQVVQPYLTTISIVDSRPTKSGMICKFLKWGSSIRTNMLCALWGWNENVNAKKGCNILIILDLMWWPQACSSKLKPNLQHPDIAWINLI